jgi:hypothetical protein
MRLEQAAAGSWPVHMGVVQDSGRLLQAMVTACKGSHDAVVRVYEALLRWAWFGCGRWACGQVWVTGLVAVLSPYSSLTAASIFEHGL